MRKLSVTAVLLLLFGLPGAQAMDMDAYLVSKNCMTCHNPQSRVLGPSFKQISERYKVDPEAIDALSKSISRGSVGKWGTYPMPANMQITPEEARKVAQWLITANNL